MRDPPALGKRLFAAFYPRIVGLAENGGQRETRRELISQAAGRTLEIGAGHGLNLPHYGERVSELVISEPSPHMLRRLRRALDGAAPNVGSWSVVATGAEALPFDGASFDTVVCTFVLCTVPDPRRALAEVARVLRPGGRLLFLEHVRARDGTALGRFQDLVAPPHRRLGAGCHPNRRTGQLIEDSSLSVERLEHGRQPRALATVRPTIIGSARREPETPRRE
jgi:ubiquinone/menaquinone biosynthesis C-methylase UbiE